MKSQIKLSFLSFCLFFTFNAYSQVSPTKIISDPIKYNDYVIEQQNLIGTGIIALINIFGDSLSTKAMAIDQLNAILKSTSVAIDNISNLKALTPDYGLKENALNLFTFYKRIMGSTYFTLIDEFYSEQVNAEKLNELVNSISAEEAGFDQAFQASQQKFAEENDFSLEENKLQENFE